MLQTTGAASLAAALPAPLPAAGSWPPPLGSGTPKICVGAGRNTEPAEMRQWKQVGVDYVLMGGPKMPWEEADLRSILDSFKANGIQVINLMIGGFNDVIHGKPGRDEQIENVIKSIRAAGKVGLPVIEYNFYAHRLTEGYKEEIGRAGAGLTAYDYELSKNLPPREGVGTHTRAEQLKRAKHFLEAVVPEAEKANVRLALPTFS
jgi:mannonate dehydratase